MTNNTDLTTLARLAAEFRALQEKATPGDWILRRFGNSHGGASYLMDSIPDDAHGRCVANTIATPNTNPDCEANFAFIAHSRNTPLATEALAAAEECERLRRDLKELAAEFRIGGDEFSAVRLERQQLT